MPGAKEHEHGSRTSVLKALMKLKGSTLILTHHNADPDAVGTAISMKLGLKQIGVEADLGVAESISRTTQKLATGFEFKIDPDCSKYDNVILVETSVPEQLSSVKNLRADIIIDHHAPGKLVTDIVGAFWIDENSRSAAQMVWHLFEDLKIKFDRKIALPIVAGITADTAHLRMAELEEFHIITEMLRHTDLKWTDVLNVLATPMDPSEIIAGLKAAAKMNMWKVENIVIAVSKLHSHEAPAARAIMKLGADIAIVAAEKPGEVRISSRARERVLDYGVDLAEIFKDVSEIINGSGGGHALAGSANGSKVKATDEALDFIVKAIAKKMGKPLKKLD